MKNYIEKLNELIFKNYEEFEHKHLKNIEDLCFIKSLQLEEKINAIRVILKSPYVVDSTSILNVKIMLTGLENVSEDVFKNEHMWFNSLLEFVDIATALNEDLNQLAREVFCVFLGILKTFKTTVNEGLNVQNSSIFHRLLLEAISFSSLGNVLKRIDEDTLDFRNVPYVINGESCILTMAKSFVLLDSFSTNLFKNKNKK